VQAANPAEMCFGFISGNLESGVGGVCVLIQITPQLRILVAIDAIDGRKYAPSTIMRSKELRTRKNQSPGRIWTAHNGTLPLRSEHGQ
jgi:hypothetical protein